ncbi:alpha/beta fold hydrolase [Pseudomonas sp. MAHUQ-62]|jgi:pimeloyl-ACP methyl ester carboxylesterase|uniref:alpha/beta fold hydrolase n=1 Tax=Pseudomonas sp. GCM10023245 TaxID=3252652 RepID=UPI00361E8BA8
MSDLQLNTLVMDGLQVRVAVQGKGPLVILCHGFPELWYSWRHQLQALAGAGFRVAAPDMRGYGGTTAPPSVEAYTRLHLVGDMVGLVRALGERQAVIVGHDWGAVVAWTAALLRPDLFRAVVGISVPYSPPDPTDVLSTLETWGIHDFYIQYFQAPGVAEAELERDVESSMRKILHCGSGDWQGEPAFGRIALERGFLGNMREPATLSPWLTEEDITYYASEFTRTGFRGGLNWYRTLKTSCELMSPWRGCRVRQPALFMAGARDSVLDFPGIPQLIEALPRTAPELRGCHLLQGAGHWVQQERPADVNELLLDFLRGL